ncbi:MAG TPA: NAD-dependent protein deacylase, partial [Candidatus Fournierella merdigallinarum]|nr:NAD-dependent protein deacylase [Candidatus Fournierella merdigallinarum]
VIKPDVVLYGEGLDPDTLSAAVQAVAQADMLLIGGTQLSVYPAAGLVDYFRGQDLAVINLSATPRDEQAALTIHRPIGEVLAAVVP